MIGVRLPLPAPKNSMSKENYFNQEYSASRKKVLGELKTMAETESPQAQEDWDIVWIISGPEINFTGRVNPGEKAIPNYNQTRRRFEAGLRIAREVTALRLRKKPEEVTKEDILNHGPNIYYNAKEISNEYAREIAKPDNLLETEYDFPGKKIIVTDNQSIMNTDHQFEDFPAEMMKPNAKVVIVSNLHHLPRIKRYVQKYPDKLPPEQIVLYPVPVEKNKIPATAYMGEIKKIYPYQKKGFCRQNLQLVNKLAPIDIGRFLG